MGLWEPGKVEGLTLSMIQRVAARAVSDHDYEPRCECGLRTSDDEP